MRKHQLYANRSYSPFGSCEMSPKANPRHPALPPDKSDFETPNTDVKRRRILRSTPISKKENKEINQESSEPALPTTRSVSAPDPDHSLLHEESQPADISNCAPTVSDFDADPMEVDFFSSSNRKLYYTNAEDEIIVQFVLKGQNIFRVSSILLWKHLESKKDNPKRTYQSLKNRFLRNIKPHLFTKFRHLINDKETRDRVLKIFPELKKQLGSPNALTLTKPGDKFAGVSNSSESPRHENPERTAATTSVTSSQLSACIAVDRAISDGVAFHREASFKNNSIIVTVDFDKIKRQKRMPFEPLKEKFKKLMVNTECVPCSTCGRYNRRSKRGICSSSDTENESDILIPNSVDGSKNSKSQKSGFDVENNRITKGVRENSDLENNQNLMYEDEFGKNASESDDSGSEVIEDLCSVKSVSEEMNSCRSNESTITEDFEETLVAKPETDSSPEKTCRDTDSDLEIVYSSLTSKFQKLINADEEKKLSRKCLLKNRDCIGFNSNVDQNLDSFFLESSEEIETPSLTNESLGRSISKTFESEIPSDSSLASNMMKMLAKEK